MNQDEQVRVIKHIPLFLPSYSAQRPNVDETDIKFKLWNFKRS